MTRRLTVAALLLAYMTSASGYFGGFPLSSKGWQASIVNQKGINSDHALAVGKVTKADAEEYCARDPGGETKAYGGKLTKRQCVDRVLREERGKQVSASADCPKKTVRPDWGGTYAIIDRRWVSDSEPAFWEYTWKNLNTGEVLDGSSASGAPVIEATFKMLCPAYIKSSNP